MRTRQGRHRSLLWPLGIVLSAAFAIAVTADRPTEDPRGSVSSRTQADPDSPREMAPAHLTFEPSEVDLGSLEPGEGRSVEVGWRRMGPGPLRVHGVSTGCGCLMTDSLPRDLDAGATGRVTLRATAPSRPGPFRLRLSVVTDARRRDPHRGCEVVTLPVRGWVRASVVASPDTLRLGDRTLASLVERRIEIVATQEAATLPLVSVLDGLDGQVEIEPPLCHDRAGWCLRLRIDVPSQPGPFAGAVRVAIGPRIRLRVSVTGRAVR